MTSVVNSSEQFDTTAADVPVSTVPTDIAPVYTDPAGDIPRPRVRSRTLWKDMRDTVVMVIAIYTLVNLVAPRYIVEGSSMQPNFETGEWIIVNRLPYLSGQPQRGDVVVLDFPEPQEDLIKRVVGLPGETIEIHDGLVFVDGVPLDEPYINSPPRYTKQPVTLGADEYYVLGDNRNNSRDSHAFGPVTEDHIVGQAWLIYWPPPDWGAVFHPGYTAPAATPLPSATPSPIPTVTPYPSPTYEPPAP